MKAILLRHLLACIILMLLPITMVNAQFYFGSMQEFGKNRIQHKEFVWQYYQFNRFTTHFYTGGKDIAQYVGKNASVHIEQTEDIMDFNIEHPMEFVIFNSHADFIQSNIGYDLDESFNIGGVTNAMDNKVFLFFEGDYEKLNRQIRYGATLVVINQMMYGGNWREAVRSSTLLNIPDWFSQGLASYISYEWDTHLDNKVRDGVMSEKFKRFNRLSDEEMKYAGHAMWNYIAEVYGKGVIPNILYMTKISRNIESGFLYVLGVSTNTLTDEFLKFYKKKYLFDESGRVDLNAEKHPVKTKKSRSYDQYILSRNGNFGAYVSHEMGQSRLYIAEIGDYDKEKDRNVKSYQISKNGVKLQRLNDHSNPVLAWHPQMDVLAYVTEEKGELLLNIFTLFNNNDPEKPLYKGFDPFGKKVNKGINTIKLLNLDKVLHMDYAPDGKHLVFSGVKDGKTNIYHYRIIGNRHEKITDDQYDDLYPAFNVDGSKIIFSSNRPDDTLRKEYRYQPKKGYNLFEYSLATKKLTQFSNTSGANDVQASAYDYNQYSYLSDKTGIYNRYVSYMDSTISHIDTTVHYRFFTKTYPVSNLRRNILNYRINEKNGQYSSLIQEDGKYSFYKGLTSQDRIYSFSDIHPTVFFSDQSYIQKIRQQESDSKFLKETSKKDSIDFNSININFYLFEDEKEQLLEESKQVFKEDAEKIIDKAEKAEAQDTNTAKEEEFKVPTQRNYNLNFTNSKLTTQFDNSYLSQTYQPFTGAASGFRMPGINGLVMYSAEDLFEDYRILAGFRISPTLDTEYFLSLDDLSKKTDKKYTFYRQSMTLPFGNQISRFITNEGRVRFSYPFSEVSSIRYSIIGRYDRQIVLSNTSDFAPIPDSYRFMLGNKLEYVFDNTLNLGLNLMRGTRLKLFAEYFQPIEANTDIFIVGMDIRNYTKIYKELIWANRVAASSSFGSQRLIYYMGGVDNWFRPRFDHDNQVPTDQLFAFQTIATPVRGHIQNARNGNNFAVINSELRFPIFKSLSNKPIRSDFVENFQVIAFGDVGSAWAGPHPYSEENPFNTEVIYQPNNTNPTLTITLQKQSEPIIGGFGLGARSRIWGYFIRFDYAWGVNNGVVTSPITYISLGLDF
jgi:Tol biopolymer transport system component